jgi:hypothetical protein
MDTHQKDIPFVVAQRSGVKNGNILVKPLGLVLATCQESAFEQASRRWSRCGPLLEPKRWEKVSLKIRMSALRADRGEDISFKGIGKLNAGRL